VAGKTAAEFLRSFERSGFMVDATFTPPGVGAVPVTFKCLYQDAESRIRLGAIMAVEPEITFEAAYCPDLTNGDALVIGGATFKVRDGGDFRDATARRFRVRKA
jgi:hypothetical protein